MGRFVKWLARLSAIVMATTAVVAIGSAARADSGDGLVSCNTGEICLSRDANSHNFVKHFWYGGPHDMYYFWDISGNKQSNTRVIYNVSAIANKDTQCHITIYDQYGTGESWDRGDSTYRSWLSHMTSKYWWAGPAVWAALAAAWNDANHHHTRC